MMDFKLIFDALPGCYLILKADAPDYTIITANDAYLTVTSSSLSIIGKGIFEVFPDSPANDNSSGAENLKRSLLEAINTGNIQHMPVQRYDTIIRNSANFEKKYWKPVNIPVKDRNGNIEYLIHHVQDVTTAMMADMTIQKQDALTQKLIIDAIHTTREIERMEISRELHDNINQILNTSRLYLERSLTKYPVEENMLVAAHTLLETAMKEIKNLSHALNRPSEEEIHLTNALEDLLSHVLEVKPINIVKSIDLPDEMIIESKVKTAVIRIIQEQLSNVLKHSDARNVYFDLHFKNNKLYLTIKDDGKGFDAMKNAKGMGFRNIKSRVAMIDGEVNIISSPGDGCMIHVHIPVNPGRMN